MELDKPLGFWMLSLELLHLLCGKDSNNDAAGAAGGGLCLSRVTFTKNTRYSENTTDSSLNALVSTKPWRHQSQPVSDIKQ